MPGPCPLLSWQCDWLLSVQTWVAGGWYSILTVWAWHECVCCDRTKRQRKRNERDRRMTNRANKAQDGPSPWPQLCVSTHAATPPPEDIQNECLAWRVGEGLITAQPTLHTRSTSCKGLHWGIRERAVGTQTKNKIPSDTSASSLSVLWPIFMLALHPTWGRKLCDR